LHTAALSETHTLSLHDALPISTQSLPRLKKIPNAPAPRASPLPRPAAQSQRVATVRRDATSPSPAPPPDASRPNGTASAAVRTRDRKSTRLNSSHVAISYAVFC